MIDDRARDALKLAETVIALAEKEGATEAEALVMSDEAALTRFANSQIHQNVAESNVVVNLRFVVGKRVGVASSGRTDDEGLRRLAANAGAIARVVEELDDWGGLPGPTAAEDPGTGYSEGTAGASPESRAEGVRQVIAAADTAGVTAFGSFSTGTETIAVANSKGARQHGTRTVAQLLTVSMGPDGGSGYAETAAVDSTTIDAAALGREASAKARATANAVTLEAGDYPVVLEEYAVVDIMDMLGYLGFSALAVQEGRSFVEVGKRIGSDLVTITDDGRDPAGLPHWFDFEGVAKAARAAGQGRPVSGRGLRRADGRSRQRPIDRPRAPGAERLWPLSAEHGDGPGSVSRDDLVSGLDRGLLVTRFHYTNPVHPKLAIVTGMTRDGTFLVEDGKVVAPVKNLRFTQSYLDALTGTVAVARERRTLKGFLGGVVVPAVRHRRMDVYWYN